MYIRLSALLPVAALAAVVAAAPSALEARTGSSQCDTGSIQCCQATTQANSPGIATLLGLLGIVIQDITGLVGLGCSPIQVLSSSSCAQQPVCCTNDNFNGVVAIGCSPININL